MATGVSKRLTDALPGAAQNQVVKRQPAPAATPKLMGDPARSLSAPSFAGYAGDTGPKPGPGYSSAVSGLRGGLGGGQPQTVADTLTQPRSRANTTLDRLQGMTEADPYKFTAPQAFSYDQNTDPAYQAALASARANIDQSQKDTNAQLRATGQGKSSYSETVANQIGAKEMARVSTDVLPELISQAFTRYQDQENRKTSNEINNYGAQQDQTANLAGLFDRQNIQDFSNPLAEGQLTGNYQSNEARQYMDAILGLKQQAEAPGVTPEARAGFSKQADAYRAALQSLGVNPAGFGADVTGQAAAGNVAGAGVRTLGGLAEDRASKMGNFDAYLGVVDRSGNFGAGPSNTYSSLIKNANAGGQTLGGLNSQLNTTATLAGLTGFMPDGTPTNATQQQQLGNLWQLASITGAIPDQLAQLYGLPKGMPTAQAFQWAAGFNQNQEQFYAGFGLDQDAADRQWAELDYNMANPKSSSSASNYAGLTPGQLLSSLRTNYTEPKVPKLDKDGLPVFDGNGDPVETGGGITTDANKRYQLFLDVLDSGLEGGSAAEDQLLISLGMTKAEIKKMEDRAAKENSINPKG